jgi:hypothetical protein
MCNCFREESLRNAEANEISRKQKKVKLVQTAQPHATPEDNTLSNDLERSPIAINTENALRRITAKSNEPPTLVSRRDTVKDARTVFVGNVALSVKKKVCSLVFL